ncbi:MAG: hypothetical protein QM520_01965, partial [Gammaproteobacteria bacterium]|nr:hypothetical protein [Gammaproteobacteria bacterium]
APALAIKWVPEYLTHLKLILDTMSPSAPQATFYDTPLLKAVAGGNIPLMTVVAEEYSQLTVNFLHENLSKVVLSKSYTINSATTQITLTNSEWLLLASNGVATIQINARDNAGNTSLSSSFSYPFDVVAPPKPIPIFVDSGTSQQDNITNQPVVSISNLEGSASWSYSIDNSLTIKGIGSTLTALNGQHIYGIRQTDLAGNVSALTEFNLRLDQGVPEAPMITKLADHINRAQALYSGIAQIQAPIGYQIKLTLTDSFNHQISKDISSRGIHTITLSSSELATLVDGNLVVQATVFDFAGNSSSSSNVSLELDSTLPSAPQLKLETGLSELNFSDLVRGEVQFLSDANSQVTLFWRFNQNHQQVLYKTVQASGAWQSVQLSSNEIFNLTKGLKGFVEVIATAGDQVQNLSASSSSLRFGVDATPLGEPSFVTPNGTTNQSSIILDDLQPWANWQYRVRTPTGDWEGWQLGYRSSIPAREGKFVYQARQFDNYGNISSMSEELTIDYDSLTPTGLNVLYREDGSGKLIDSKLYLSQVEHGATVQVRIDNASQWNSTDGSIFFARGGSHTYAFRQIDLAQNISPETTITVNYDNTNAPHIDLMDKGWYSDDHITNNPTLLVSTSSAYWEYRIDDNPEWFQGTGSILSAQSGVHTYQVRNFDPITTKVSASSYISLNYHPSVIDVPQIQYSDTGRSSTDNLTINPLVYITNLTSQLKWSYKVDDGSWQLGTGSSLTASSGEHTYQIQFNSLAGALSEVKEFQFNFDANAVVPPNITSPMGNVVSGVLYTNTSQAHISSLKSNSFWEYKINNEDRWRAGGEGTTFNLTLGANTYQTRQMNVAGRYSPASDVQTIVYSNQIPSSINVRLLSDTGVIGDSVTHNSTMVIVGLGPNNSWAYRVDGSQGTWVRGSGTTFQASAGIHSYEVAQTDLANNVSLISKPLIANYRAQNQATPSITYLDTGILETDGVTGNPALTVQNVLSGASWYYKVDNKAAWLLGSGTQIQAANGVHTYQVIQVDGAGNTSPSSQLYTINYDVALPSVHFSLHYTPQPEIPSVTHNPILTLKGLQFSSTWQYQVDGGTWAQGTGVTLDLLDGTHTYRAFQVSSEGVTGAVFSLVDLVLDIDFPIAPELSILVDSGINPSDGITGNPTLVAMGLENQASWYYIVDQNMGEPIRGIGSVFLADPGTHTYSIYQVDIAGNTSSRSPDLIVAYDPFQTNQLLGLAFEDSGTVGDFNTNVSTLKVVGLENGSAWSYKIDGLNWIQGLGTTVIAQDGKHTYEVNQVLQGVTAISTKRLTLTLDASIPLPPNLYLTEDSGSDSSDWVTKNNGVQVDLTDGGGKFRYRWLDGIHNQLSDWIEVTGSTFNAQIGTNVYHVRQYDQADNLSNTSTITVIYDNVAPSVPGIRLLSDLGISSIDRRTANPTILVSNLESGGLWEYFSSDQNSWNLGNGSEFTVSGGTHTYQVRQYDKAGNVSAASNELTVFYSTDTVVVPTINLLSDLGSDTQDGITNIPTIVVSGLLPNVNWYYQVDGSSDWYLGSGTTLNASVGSHTYRVYQENEAGVIGSKSSILQVSLLGLEISDTGSAVDLISNNSTIRVAGLESGANWQYRIDQTSDWAIGTGSTFSALAGKHSYQVRASDTVHGQQLEGIGLSFLFDNTPPSSPALSYDPPSKDLQATIWVQNLEQGATWEYNLNDTGWQMGIGNSFLVNLSTSMGTMQVRQTDIAGNVSQILKTSPDTTLSDDFTLLPYVIGLGPALRKSFNDANIDFIAQKLGVVEVSGRNLGDRVQVLFSGSSAVIEKTVEFNTQDQLSQPIQIALESKDYELLGSGSISVRAKLTNPSFYYFGQDSEPITFNIIVGTITPPQVHLAGQLGEVLISTTPGNSVRITFSSETSGNTTTLTESNSSGNYQFLLNNAELKHLAGGSVRVSAVSLDRSGNSSIARELTLTIPTDFDKNLSSLELVLKTDTGQSKVDGVTYNPTILVAGLGFGVDWEYQIDGIGDNWLAGSGNSFLASAGKHTYVARQNSRISGVGPVDQSITVTLDNTPPLVPTLTVNDLGVSGSDSMTRDPTITVASLQDGDRFSYTIDGLSRWTRGSGSTFLALNGAHNYSVKITDLAGNISHTQSLYLDLLSIPNNNLTVYLTDDTGPSSMDWVTSNGKLNVSGIRVDSKLSYSIDNNVALVPINGSSLVLSEGKHTYRIQELDRYGNVSFRELLITKDTQKPEVPLLRSSVYGIEVLGALEDTQVVFQVDGVSQWQNVNLINGQYFIPLSSGTHSYVVKQIDLAGNESNVSHSLSVYRAPADFGQNLAIDFFDTGSSTLDGISYARKLVVTGLSPNTGWQYQVDDLGWQDMPALLTQSSEAREIPTLIGSHNYRVRQINSFGQFSQKSYEGVVIDREAPTVPVLEPVGKNDSLGGNYITTETVSRVLGLDEGATWQYKIDGGNWQNGTGTSLMLLANSHTYQLRQIDNAGNTSISSVVGIIQSNSLPIAPSNTPRSNLSFQVSAHTQQGDNYFGNEDDLPIVGLESDQTWEYRIDANSWMTGTGSTLQAQSGFHLYQVKSNGQSSAIMSYRYDTFVPASLQLEIPEQGIIGGTVATNQALLRISGLDTLNAQAFCVINDQTPVPITGEYFTLTSGLHQYSFFQVDVAGNKSISNEVRIYFDEVLPSAPILNFLRADGAEGLTNQAFLWVSELDSPEAVWYYRVDDSGDWQLGDRLNYLVGQSGTHSYQIVQVDQAKNTSVASNTLLVIDTTSVAGITLNLMSDTGKSSTDRWTNIQPTITVAGLDAGDTYSILKWNGTEFETFMAASAIGQFKISTPGDHLLKLETKTSQGVTRNIQFYAVHYDQEAPVAPLVSLSAGASHPVAQVSGLESGAVWHYKIDSSTWQTGSGSLFNALEGSHTYQVIQTDSAGNSSAVATFQVTYEATNVPLPSVSITDSGMSNRDFVTHNSTVSLLNANDASVNRVQIKANNTTWTLPAGSSEFLLQEGTHLYEVSYQGKFGETSSTRFQATLISALAPPFLSNAGLTSQRLHWVENTNPFSNWYYRMDDATEWSVGSGNYVTLSEGTHTYWLYQEDLAGNVSDKSVFITNLVTTALPPVTARIQNDDGVSSTDSYTSNPTVIIGNLVENATWQVRVVDHLSENSIRDDLGTYLSSDWLNWTTVSGSILTALAGSHRYQFRQVVENEISPITNFRMSYLNAASASIDGPANLGLVAYTGSIPASYQWTTALVPFLQIGHYTTNALNPVWSISGVDAQNFTIDTQGYLSFKSELNLTNSSSLGGNT